MKADDIKQKSHQIIETLEENVLLEVLEYLQAKLVEPKINDVECLHLEKEFENYKMRYPLA